MAQKELMPETPAQTDTEKAEMALKEERFKQYCYAYHSTTLYQPNYSGIVDKLKFQGWVKQAFRHISESSLKIGHKNFFDLCNHPENWTYSHVNMIMQFLYACTAAQLDMSMDEYEAFYIKMDKIRTVVNADLKKLEDEILRPGFDAEEEKLAQAEQEQAEIIAAIPVADETAEQVQEHS